MILDDPAATPDVVDALVRAGHRIRMVNPHDPTLEELYFAVRRSARDLAEGADGYTERLAMAQADEDDVEMEGAAR